MLPLQTREVNMCRLFKSFPLLSVLLLLFVFAVACAPTVVEPGVTPLPTTAGSAYPVPPADETVASEPYPPPGEEPTLAWTPPPDPTEPPTPTTPPFPTSIPTPVVTPIPTAEPPIIPPPSEQAAEPFTIVFPDGNVIRAINSDGADERVLIDIRARLPLFLVNERLSSERTKVDSWGWGSASPDGSRLALVLSNVETEQSLPKGELPEFNIYLFDLITGDLRPLVQGGVEPVWSPDGTRIAYRSTQTSGLWVVDVSNGETSEIYAVDRENEHFVTDINWAPDSKRLVFLDRVFRQSATIVTTDADGVDPASMLVPWEGYWLSSPRWSPDGQQILFVSLAGQSSSSDHFYNLWGMNEDGTGQTQLTQDINLSAGLPCWSPDGRWIAFTGTQYYEEPEPFTDLWLIDKTGAELKRLTSNTVEATNERMPAWSPDGTWIIFGRDGGEVWIISLTDGIQTRLPSVTANFVILS